jgi:hypothetical protein
MRRNFTRSAFNGYRTQWSASSDVYCAVCGSYWRSKAAWVDELPDADLLAELPHAEPLTSC